MPKLGLTMTTGTIVSWIKSEGENVKIKEPLLEIETEKLSYSVESPADGVLLKILADVGEKYPVSSVLGYVGTPGEKLAETLPKAQSVQEIPQQTETIKQHFSQEIQYAAASDKQRIFISPVAKKLATQLGVDYKQIRGSGPGGRIVKKDVQNFSETAKTATADTTARNVIIPYAGIRRAVGETMLGAWKSIPMVTHHVNAQACAMLEYREMVNRGVRDNAERVTIGELMLKLTAQALKMMPILNSSLTPEGIILHKQVNLGMATALEDGLYVPVIHKACGKSLLTISREAKDLATKARAGALTPDDVHGGTFTLSNLGGYGSVDFFTPIINPPQAAILGLGRITETLTAKDEAAAVCKMIGLSLTYDHRIIDGAKAAEFIKVLMELMQNPARAVLV